MLEAHIQGKNQLNQKILLEISQTPQITTSLSSITREIQLATYYNIIYKYFARFVICYTSTTELKVHNIYNKNITISSFSTKIKIIFYMEAFQNLIRFSSEVFFRWLLKEGFVALILLTLSQWSSSQL